MTIMSLRGAQFATKQSLVRGDCFALASLGSQRHVGKGQRVACPVFFGAVTIHEQMDWKLRPLTDCLRQIERCIMRDWRKIIISILQAIWLPAVAYVGAGLIMIIASRHTYVTKQLKEKATPNNRTQLNTRLQGYDTTDVAQLWGVLDRRALDSERRFLQLDLLFPLFYGGAFLVALWRVWRDLGKAFSPVWLIAPVALTVLADWTENLIQLAQLRLYLEKGNEGLQAGWIQIASAATIAKLVFFVGTLVLLICLAICRT